MTWVLTPSPRYLQDILGKIKISCKVRSGLQTGKRFVLFPCIHTSAEVASRHAPRAAVVFVPYSDALSCIYTWGHESTRIYTLFSCAVVSPVLHRSLRTAYCAVRGIMRGMRKINKWFTVDSVGRTCRDGRVRADARVVRGLRRVRPPTNGSALVCYGSRARLLVLHRARPG